MKKLIIYLLLLVTIIYSCKTTKLDVKTGDRDPTHNTIHMRKIHPYGFWTGKKYIIYPDQKKQTVNK